MKKYDNTEMPTKSPSKPPTYIAEKVEDCKLPEPSKRKLHIFSGIYINLEATQTHVILN